MSWNDVFSLVTWWGVKCWAKLQPLVRWNSISEQGRRWHKWSVILGNTNSFVGLKLSQQNAKVTLVRRVTKPLQENTSFSFSPERDPVLLNTPWPQASHAFPGSCALRSLWHAADLQLFAAKVSLQAGCCCCWPWWEHLQPPWVQAQLLGQSLAVGTVEKPHREAEAVTPSFSWQWSHLFLQRCFYVGIQEGTFKFSRPSSTEGLEKKSWVLRHKVCNLWLVTAKRW